MLLLMSQMMEHWRVQKILKTVYQNFLHNFARQIRKHIDAVLKSAKMEIKTEFIFNK